jgi:tetratricopeptide (TPR) repeat protein
MKLQNEKPVVPIILDQGARLKRHKKLFLILILLLTVPLHVVAAQTPSPAFDSKKLEKALTSIDLCELNRYEAVLKELLDQKSSPQHYLYKLYLGRIYLRTALYYESKANEDKTLLETSEQLINQARDRFKKAVREKKDFSGGYVYLALAYAQKIKYVGYPTLLRYAKRVEKNIDKALKKNPINPRAYLVRGIQTMYKPPNHGGGIDKAIPLFLKSVELDPAFHEGYYWLARAYVQSSFEGKDEEKAKSYLLKAVKLSPDDYFYQRGLTPDVQVPEYKEIKKGIKK